MASMLAVGFHRHQPLAPLPQQAGEIVHRSYFLLRNPYSKMQSSNVEYVKNRLLGKLRLEVLSTVVYYHFAPYGFTRS